MSLKVKKKVSFPPVDGGTYPAICVGIIDLGEQLNDYNNRKSYEDHVLFIWELPNVTIEIDGEKKPRWVSKEYNAVLSERSNLSKMLTSWRGVEPPDEFDLPQMIGEAALIQVVVKEKQNGELKNDITGVMGFINGVPKPQTETELLLFNMDEWNDEIFEKLPDWVKKRIMKSTQYQKFHAPDTTIEVKPMTEGECPI